MEIFVFPRDFQPLGYTGGARYFLYNGHANLENRMTVREGYTGWGSGREDSGRAGTKCPKAPAERTNAGLRR